LQEHGDTYDPNQRVASEIRTVFTCVMFLTRLPCPSWTDHHPAFLMRSMLYFPLTGLLIGAWGAVWHRAAEALFGAYIAAIVSTLATVWLTGAA
jgi:adenosylcobinamide-GDP ribazoletransferase